MTLTDAEIDRLEGRALDQAVVELVFGRDRLTARIVDDPGEPQYHWGYPVGHDVAPAYSSDWRAAALVLQSFRLGNYRPQKVACLIKMTITDAAMINDPGDCICEIMSPALAPVQAVAREMPTAICRAALKAVMRGG